ncbi:hypothetical protein E2562_004974 [Oryza meyeriana var. granulata]|uniref:RIN4 pathogenic type III effector avirulence factor Avr cleavage site domain-containing protein n=1 Tax=Oryza meyeriana var. granulata TaxID=110450 RepID=A0A6G1C2U5_9ORYZ|nr:hypothetical protein E2562_004974 [Oryza meyeriana var. granulata]
MGNRKEGEQQQRATVPAFGEWDDMKAAGVLPDYSLDFSKIRAVRMQRKEGPLTWSSAAGDAGGVAAGGVETSGRLSFRGMVHALFHNPQLSSNLETLV